MKRHFLFVIAALSALAVSATQYCGTMITGTQKSHKAYVSCHSLGGDQYEFRFVSGEPIQSYNAAGSNFYANVNGAGGFHVSENLVQNVDTLVCTITSNVAPTIYVGDFYVVYSDGEEWYKIPTDADFSLTCGTVAPDTTSTGGNPGGTTDPAGELTPGVCQGNMTTVDEFYSKANEKAVTVLNNGYNWKAETTSSSVKITVQFLDNMPGMAAPQFFQFDMENVLMGTPTPMQWDPSTLTATCQLSDVKNGDAIIFLVQVALENGGILFTSRILYSVGSDCSGSTEPEESALNDISSSQTALKVVENGRLVIIRDGIRYSALGAKIN